MRFATSVVRRAGARDTRIIVPHPSLARENVGVVVTGYYRFSDMVDQIAARRVYSVGCARASRVEARTWTNEDDEALTSDESVCKSFAKERYPACFEYSSFQLGSACARRRRRGRAVGWRRRRSVLMGYACCSFR